MKWFGLALVLVGFVHCARATPPVPMPAPAQGLASDGLEFERSIPITVLRGENDIKVELVPLQVEGGGAPEALLRVSGLDHELAGVTFRATRKISSANAEMWTVRLENTDYTLLRTRVRFPDVTLLQMPRLTQSIGLMTDPLLAFSVDTKALREDHRRRVNDGSLAELARFHREPKIKAHEQGIQRAQAELEETCGNSITVSMDWGPVPDEELLRTHYCESVLKGLKKACERNDATRRAVARQVKAVQCQRADVHALSLGAGKVLHSRESSHDAAYDGVSKAVKKAYTLLADLLKFPPTVLLEAGGLLLVYEPDANRSGLHAGRNGVLHLQRVQNVATTHIAFWHAAKFVALDSKSGQPWQAQCESSKKEFVEVEDSVRERLLASAKFQPRFWKRQAFALARDDRGIYYYVDRFDPLNGGKGYRVFRGPRGALKLTTLVDIVDDSDGMIFATTRGKLRLILNKKDDTEARWIEVKKKRPLVYLSIGENLDFIYGDMGVYEGTKFGTICDL